MFTPLLVKRACFVLFLIILSIATAAAASAVDVGFTVEVNAVDQDGTVFTDSAVASQQCGSRCEFPVGTVSAFEIPENYTFSNYTLIDADSASYSVYFSSTQGKSTQDQGDSIIVEVVQQPEEPPEEIPEEPVLVCKDDHCDRGCVKCSDDSCHPPEFECVEELGIDKLFPRTMEVGQTQLNILLRNSGTVGFVNVYALVSGDGIVTMEKMPIESLPAGDKDYAFVRINATKAGSIDLVVKLFVNARLTKTLVEQITVIEKKVSAPVETAAPEEDSESPDATEVSTQLDMLKEKYRGLEQDYLDKKSGGYDVEFIYSSLQKAQDHLVNAQTSLFEGDYRKARASIEIAEEFLNTVENQLAVAKKQQAKFSDKVRNNMIYIGSIAAAVVSTLTAYSLVKSNVNKQKLVELKEKIRRRKEESKKVEKKRRPKREQQDKREEAKEDSKEAKD
jgi:hypothetical protein